MAFFNSQRPKWIPRWLNIPLVIFIGFIIMLIFFGENNFIRTSKYRSQINELKNDNETLERLGVDRLQAKNYEDSASMYEAKTNELNTDNESLERLVREKYGMKRTNEEVYITDIP